MSRSALLILKGKETETHRKMVKKLKDLRKRGIKKLTKELKDYYFGDREVLSEIYGGDEIALTFVLRDCKYTIDVVNNPSTKRISGIKKIDEGEEFGFEVDLSKLPKGVERIKFVNFYED